MRLIINNEYDKLIKNTFFITRKTGKLGLNSNYKYFLNEDLTNYINNCFDDSLSFKESLYRIYYNVDIHPKCKYCGKLVIFDIRENNLFRDYCNSKQCVKKIQSEKGKQTKLEHYGNENYNNRDKFKQTYYSRTDEEKQETTNKIKQTKLERYGDENYVNPNKGKQTKLERYGNENYNNKEKCKKTCLEKYGAEYTLSRKSSIRNKIKQANINKYGFYYVNVEKGKQTKLERYGNENYNNKEKIQQTCIERFGYNTIFKVPEIAKRTADSEIRKQKEYITKKKNGTHNSSIREDECYELLKQKYPDVKRQYHSELYPFNCDFYIPSLDLYIEYNGLWTHGCHPFDSNNIEDQNKLQQWIDKNTDYYKNAIDVWTRRDVEKRNKAKENNLNFIEFWDMNEVYNFINNE